MSCGPDTFRLKLTAEAVDLYAVSLDRDAGQDGDFVSDYLCLLARATRAFPQPWPKPPKSQKGPLDFLSLYRPWHETGLPPNGRS